MPLKVRVTLIPPNYITTSLQIHTRAVTGRATRIAKTWHREPVVPKCMSSTAYPRLVLLALPFFLFQVCLMIDEGVPAGKKGMVIMEGALAGGSWSEGSVSLGWLQFAVNRLQGWKLVMGVQQKNLWLWALQLQHYDKCECVNTSQNRQRQRSSSWGKMRMGARKRKEKAFE